MVSGIGMVIEWKSAAEIELAPRSRSRQTPALAAGRGGGMDPPAASHTPALHPGLPASMESPAAFTSLDLSPKRSGFQNLRTPHLREKGYGCAKYVLIARRAPACTKSSRRRSSPRPKRPANQTENRKLLAKGKNVRPQIQIYFIVVDNPKREKLCSR